MCIASIAAASSAVRNCANSAPVCLTLFERLRRRTGWTTRKLFLCREPRAVYYSSALEKNHLFYRRFTVHFQECTLQVPWLIKDFDRLAARSEDIPSCFSPFPLWDRATAVLSAHTCCAWKGGEDGGDGFCEPREDGGGGFLSLFERRKVSICNERRRFVEKRKKYTVTEEGFSPLF